MSEYERAKIWTTVEQLLNDRGYTIYQQIDDMVGIGMTNNNYSILVYFSYDPKINKQTMIEYIKLLSEHHADQGILIYNKEITPHVNGALYEQDIQIQTFRAKELMINITKHKMVPPHHKIEGEEREEVLKKYGDVRKIRHDDAVVRYYGWPAGTLIRIDQLPIPDYRMVVIGQKIQIGNKKRTEE